MKSAHGIVAGGCTTPPGAFGLRWKPTKQDTERLVGRVRHVASWPSPSAANDASLWQSLLRINRALRVMLHMRWSAEAWSVVRLEFRPVRALPPGDASDPVLRRGAALRGQFLHDRRRRAVRGAHEVPARAQGPANIRRPGQQGGERCSAASSAAPSREVAPRRAQCWRCHGSARTRLRSTRYRGSKSGSCSRKD